MDPIVLRFRRVTVGREGTSDCTRVPLLQDLPVLLPLVLHRPVGPIRPGRPVVSLQPGRSVAGHPVVGLPSGKVLQKVPKKVPQKDPPLPAMLFPPLTPPPPSPRVGCTKRSPKRAPSPCYVISSNHSPPSPRDAARFPSTKTDSMWLRGTRCTRRSCVV